MKKKLILFLYFLILCFHSVSHATDNQYIVDVIILKHSNIEEYPANLFFSEKIQIDDSQLIDFDIAECSNDDILEETDKIENSYEYQCDQEYILISEGYKPLENEKQKIQKSPKFSVLKHITWQQPGYDKKNSKPVRLIAGEDLTKRYIDEAIDEKTIDVLSQGRLHEIHGFAKIHLDEYFTFVIQLTLNYFNKKTGKLSQLKLSANKRLNDNETHYIDHPIIGAIINITTLDNFIKQKILFEETTH